MLCYYVWREAIFAALIHGKGVTANESETDCCDRCCCDNESDLLLPDAV